MNRNKHFTDVVCGMDIESEDINTEHQGIRYVFCSEQCLQRFQSNPHLYVGFPGSEAPKHAGVDAIRTRTLKLSEPLPQELADEVVDTVMAMMGIQVIVVQDDQITITYDLLQVTEAQIEESIVAAGAALGVGWTESIKRAFIQTMEETEVAALEARPKSMRGHNH